MASRQRAGNGGGNGNGKATANGEALLRRGAAAPGAREDRPGRLRLLGSEGDPGSSFAAGGRDRRARRPRARPSPRACSGTSRPRGSTSSLTEVLDGRDDRRRDRRDPSGDARRARRRGARRRQARAGREAPGPERRRLPHARRAGARRRSDADGRAHVPLQPAVQHVRQLIAQHELGEVYYIDSQRLNLGRVRQDVDAIWNFAPARHLDHPALVRTQAGGGPLPRLRLPAAGNP